MAKTKSTKNSKLPAVSRVRFAAAVNSTKDSATIATKSGTWTAKVRFKQSSKKYPYQVQYRTKKYYDSETAKTKGDATKWSAWKSITTDKTEAADPVNKWLKSNVGVNKKSTYQIAKVFTDQKIPDGFYKAQVQVRIRTFNKAKATHGTWTTQTLTILRKDSITNEKLHKGVNGGAYIDFDISTYSAGKIVITGLKDAEGRNLLKVNSITKGITMQTDAHGFVSIDSKYLKRELTQGESVNFAGYFISDLDSIKTSLTIEKVDDTQSTLKPSLAITYDSETGTVKVAIPTIGTAYKMGCSVSYTYHGKKYTQKYDKYQDGAYYFTPPFGIDLTFNAATLDSSFNYATTAKTYKVTGSGYVLNGLSVDDSIVAIGWGEPSFTISSTAQTEQDHPFGNSADVVFYGEGTSTSITFSAKIIDKADQVGGVNAARQGWEKVRANPGIYRFRTNRGDSYTVAVTNVQISLNKCNIYDVTATMTEVIYG